MSRPQKFLFLTGIAFLVFLAVPTASNAAAPESQVLHIDPGFIGHPVSLDVLENNVRIAWQKDDLLYESDIYIDVTSSTAATSSELSVVWSSSYALGDQGVELGIKPEFGPVTTTSAWEDIVVETKEPFGDWKRPAMKIKDGYLTVRVGPEIQARLVVVPRGMRSGEATWYKYKAGMFAASPDFPKGTKLRVAVKGKPENSIIITVNDYGPDRRLFPSRVIDLDSVAFKKLSPLSAGKLQVTVEPLDKPKIQDLALK
ncbi:RlpA-like double-psi beta-barrel domain-containing protein [Candidatus Uhrbacteria bacterium]|nr:RlpA-like double-psi beta-barrel domain-containing protein [Candidatus Uhrbacteria bacterium]